MGNLTIRITTSNEISPYRCIRRDFKILSVTLLTTIVPDFQGLLWWMGNIRQGSSKLN